MAKEANRPAAPAAVGEQFGASLAKLEAKLTTAPIAEMLDAAGILMRQMIGIEDEGVVGAVEPVFWKLLDRATFVLASDPWITEHLEPAHVHVWLQAEVWKRVFPDLPVPRWLWGRLKRLDDKQTRVIWVDGRPAFDYTDDPTEQVELRPYVTWLSNEVSGRQSPNRGRRHGSKRPDPLFPKRYRDALVAIYGGGQTDIPNYSELASAIGCSESTAQRQVRDHKLPWPPPWPPEKYLALFELRAGC